MATPREREAADYLEEHKIPELVHNLTSMLFFHRPERPKEFLIAQLEQLRVSKLHSVESPCLFNDSNLDAVFGILDPARQGHITFAQYKEALTTLGIKSYNEFPDGAACDKISRETFNKEAKEGLLKSSATFSI
ncbi:EF-hand calcium-binding domain-containing protein 10 [Denticeps clupeoides]|uniref:EF-hand domain-containing protein n=1 Tax=Denticeps clupeoides TaxID=299321 RepID=A0AAY4BEZ2_9TELE|nr:EF-hand calcium-binding domain-containing protein 10 [Denticeps clupeoides]XP_028813664.1 EF-hand calcium-binding domain-containing protein 10 [Denticeps clupeoides]